MHAQLTCALSDMLQTHKELVAGVLDLAGRVQADKQLTALIRRKFAIKCTTGYSLNALVDFSLDDPIEIIKRLMIGSEGTFGFVSEATYNCVPEWPHKVSPSSLVLDVVVCTTAQVAEGQTVLIQTRPVAILITIPRDHASEFILNGMAVQNGTL